MPTPTSSTGPDQGNAPLALIYITCPDAAVAERIGRALVEDRLAACANVLPGMRSCYRWQGAVETADEAVLIAKTRAALVDAVTARVKALHPYTVPCVVAVPVSGGSAEYLAWVIGETRDHGDPDAGLFTR